MNTQPYLIGLVCLVSASLANAQQPTVPRPAAQAPRAPPPMQAQRPPLVGHAELLAENFFPPELVMQHQHAIGLTPEQRTAIRAEMQKTMAKLTDLQWQLSGETESMAALVSQEHPDEKETLAQFEKIAGLDQEVKRSQFALMLKIKNVLTPEQQAKLRGLKRPAGRAGPHGIAGPGPVPEGGPGGPPPD